MMLPVVSYWEGIIGLASQQLEGHCGSEYLHPLPWCQFTFDFFLKEQLTKTDRPTGWHPVPFCSSMVPQYHQGVLSLQLLSAAAVSSGAAGVPHPGRDLQEGQVSPTHPSSSGRPGWSQKLQHTTAWESLCPAHDVCCTAERRKL